MTTNSSILAWRTPWTEEPGGLQSVGSQRIKHILVMKHRERERERRITTEMSCRNELPLRSQAQEGLLCQCSQATGSDGLLLLMVPLELQEASPGSKPQSLALSWSSILLLFSFFQPVFSKRSTWQRDLWDEMKANTVKMSEEEGDGH